MYRMGSRNSMDGFPIIDTKRTYKTLRTIDPLVSIDTSG